MPIYEYRCNDCGRETEALQKVSDTPLKVCPECGHETLVKLVSAAGFQLKGTGWYATDFKGGSKPAAGDAAKSADKTGGAEGASKGGDAPACGAGACPTCQ
jgi:putative FmdB family regulatory protein